MARAIRAPHSSTSEVRSVAVGEYPFAAITKPGCAKQAKCWGPPAVSVSFHAGNLQIMRILKIGRRKVDRPDG